MREFRTRTIKPRYLRLDSAARGRRESESTPAGPALPPPPEGMAARILQFARTRYAGFNDHYLCEKLDDRRSSFRRAECSNPEHALIRFPVAKWLVLLSRY
jgi:hypothetical protein